MQLIANFEPCGKEDSFLLLQRLLLFRRKELKKQEGLCAYPPATTNPLLLTCATEQRLSWVTCPALSLPLQLLMKASGKELTSECDLPLNLWSPVTFDWHASPYLAFGTLLKFNWFWTEPFSPLCSATGLCHSLWFPSLWRGLPTLEFTLRWLCNLSSQMVSKQWLFARPFLIAKMGATLFVVVYILGNRNPLHTIF